MVMEVPSIARRALRMALPMAELLVATSARVKYFLVPSTEARQPSVR